MRTARLVLVTALCLGLVGCTQTYQSPAYHAARSTQIWTVKPGYQSPLKGGRSVYEVRRIR